MTDEVAEQEVVESQEPEAPEAPDPATLAAELATTRKRLSGKDQALTAAQQAKATAEAELETLRQWKAEKEKADMSEVDRLKAELTEARSREAQATATATRVALAAKFPLTSDLLGDAMPSDEVRLAEIEARLKAEESDEPATRIDPNNPRRAAAKPQARTIEVIKAEMARAYPG